MVSILFDEETKEHTHTRNQKIRSYKPKPAHAAEAIKKSLESLVQCIRQQLKSVSVLVRTSH